MARVIGGYFAQLIIPNISVRGFIQKMGPFEFNELPRNLTDSFGPYNFPVPGKTDEIKDYLLDLKAKGGKVSVAEPE